MPIYEMECPACGCKFEVRQSYEDRALIRCPKCRTPIERLSSKSNFVMKI
jgi:putative FmdB family regulatory protein